MPRVLYQGLYPPFGYAPQNEPANPRECNPLPPNKMRADTGDAGQDGYTVLSRANRYDGCRPAIDSEPEFTGPNLSYNED